MKVGDTATLRRVFGANADSDVTQVLPAIMIGQMFSTLLGMTLPGPGTRYLKQSLTFADRPHHGETLCAIVTISRLRTEKRLADVATTCRGEDGRDICTGRALVKYPQTVAPEGQTP